MRVEQLTLFDLPPQNVSKNVCLNIKDFAKFLASKGFDTGEKKMFRDLRSWQLIDKYNVPYKKYVDCGYFKIIRENYRRANNGGCYVYLKTLVTPCGQKYIEERYRNERDGDRA